MHMHQYTFKQGLSLLKEILEIPPQKVSKDNPKKQAIINTILNHQQHLILTQHKQLNKEESRKDL